MMVAVPDAATQDHRELTDVARAIAGGLLFGVPLLFTMELWWAGQRAGPTRSLLLLAIALTAALVLQRTSGFRRTVDIRWRDALLDAVDVVGISLVVVTVVLVVLREVTASTPLGIALGKIVQQALAFTIGAGVAHHYLRESRGEPADDRTGGEDRSIDATVADIGATAIGAVFIALNVAPTDEIPMLHAQIDPVWTVVVVATSLAASYLIVFVAGFSGQAQRRDQRGILQHPSTETTVCYLVSLLCSLGMLAMFDRLTGSWAQDLSMAVILGFPATVGGAAGRLAV
jgi:putative integral membrane protein (TIGR02587 family)